MTRTRKRQNTAASRRPSPKPVDDLQIHAEWTKTADHSSAWLELWQRILAEVGVPERSRESSE